MITIQQHSTAQENRKNENYERVDAGILKAAQAGNQAAIQAVYNAVVVYANAIAMRRYGKILKDNPAVTEDDLKQSAAEGLLYALRFYDPSREKEEGSTDAFYSCLAYYVRTVCQNALSLRSTQKHVIYGCDSLDRPIIGDDMDEINLCDTIADPDAIDPEQAATCSNTADYIGEQLRIYSRPMPAALRVIYDLRVQGYSNQQVARMLKMDPAAAAKEYYRALLWMRHQRPVKRLRDEFIPLSYSHKVGLMYFNNTGYSAVEAIAMSREKAYQQNNYQRASI